MSRESDRSLPANLDAERFILGSLLLDGERVADIASSIEEDFFAMEKHRRIFRRMMEVHGRGVKVDRVTVAEELLRRGELESVDGLSYLVSLDDGLPANVNLASYIGIIRDKSHLRKIVIAAQHTMNRAFLAEESPDDILRGAEESLLSIGESRQKDDAGLVQGGEYVRSFPGGWQRFVEPDKRDNGLKTGFTKFDEMTGGLRAGELIIVGARPSVGKSAWSMNVAWNIARNGTPVAVFSLEMSIESLLLRILCSAARIDSQRLRAGYLSEQERNKLRAARDLIMDAPLYIDDSSNIGLLEIHAKLRQFKRKYKVDPGLVVVDYLQLMARQGKGDNENADLTRLSRGLKLMSKEMKCPFLVLSQLSRAPEQRTGDKRPTLSDLRGSGAIEQDADIIGFLYRPEMHARDREDLRGLAEMLLAKSRSGPIGKIDLIFLHALVRFENPAEDLGDLPPEEDEGRLPYTD